MRAARGAAAALLGLALAWAAPAFAQEGVPPLPGEASGPRPLGVERASPLPTAADSLSVRSLFGSYRWVADRFSATWRGDGERWVTVERDSRGRPSL
ncbi:MAG: hypothetical protein ABEJ46_02175, partial [Gemmatimonadota bacterium]